MYDLWPWPLISTDLGGSIKYIPKDVPKDGDAIHHIKVLKENIDNLKDIKVFDKAAQIG